MSASGITPFAFVPGRGLASTDLPREHPARNDTFQRELQRAHAAFQDPPPSRPHLARGPAAQQDIGSALLDLPPRGKFHFVDEVVAFLEGWGDVKIQRVERLSDVAVTAACNANESVAVGRPAAHLASLPSPDMLAMESEAKPLASGCAIRGLRNTESRKESERVAATTTLAGQTPPPPSLVRVHADWTGEGVRVWLGMDAAEAGNPQFLASQLQRWLATQGVRCISLTCNGETLFEERHPNTPAHFKEQA